MFETIGPVWDGNEVWLVVAGGATFAAFPAWYATMFSGFYLALLLVLVFLIVRVVSFEWRDEEREPRAGGAPGLWANTIGSFGASLIWGVALSNLLHGVPLDSSGDFAGTLLGPLQRLHGARGPRGRAALRLPRRHVPHAAHDGRALQRAPRAARRLSIPAAVVGRGLPRLDGGRRGRPQRQGRLPAAAARRARDRRARAGGRRSCAAGAAAGRSR